MFQLHNAHLNDVQIARHGQQRDSEVSVNSTNRRFLTKRVNFSEITVKDVNLYQLSNISNTGSQVAKASVGDQYFESIWIICLGKYESNKKADRSSDCRE